MRHLKFVLAGLLFATPAFAQPTDGEAEASAEGEVGVDVNAGVGGEAGADGTAGVEGGATDGGAIDAAWPRSAGDRPYFRSKGKITAGGDLSFVKFSSNDGMGNTFSATFDFITLRGAYAVSDQLSVGLNYAISLGLGDGDFEIVGPLTLWGGYQIKHDPKLSVAATGAFSINLDDTDDMAIGAGLGLRYTVAPKIAVFTGQPYGPGAVGGSGFGGPLFGQLFGGGHLSISLADMGPILFDLPIGGMFQATPELNINLTTTLASIALSNSPYGDANGEKSAFIFGADYIPLSVGGLYSVNEMIDITANFSLFDLKEVGFDLFAFSVGARAHL